MSSAPDELTGFVKAALARGVSREQIEATLRSAGWTGDQTRAALARFADSDFPIPVPWPRPYVDARDALIYLVLLAALHMISYHLGRLLLDIINDTFPE